MFARYFVFFVSARHQPKNLIYSDSPLLGTDALFHPLNCIQHFLKSGFLFWRFSWNKFSIGSLCRIRIHHYFPIWRRISDYQLHITIITITYYFMVHHQNSRLTWTMCWWIMVCLILLQKLKALFKVELYWTDCSIFIPCHFCVKLGLFSVWGRASSPLGCF